MEGAVGVVHVQHGFLERREGVATGRAGRDTGSGCSGGSGCLVSLLLGLLLLLLWLLRLLLRARVVVTGSS